MKFLLSTQATLIAATVSLFAALANGNPVPELEKRITCIINYIPACCNYIEYQSYPSLVPGASAGCVARAAEPGNVCPSSGASTLRCCQKGLLNSQTLRYQPDGTSYCYIP